MRRGRRLLLVGVALVLAVVASGCGVPLIGSRASAPAGAGQARVGGGRAGGRGRDASASPGGASTPEARIRATVAQAQRTHEIPTPASGPSHGALGGWRSPVEAVQVFTQWYINWTAATVATHMHILAQAAIGQARSAMTLAASSVAHDASLKLGGIANSGTVEGIAPLADHNDVYAVVTREQTRAANTSAYQGLRPSWHVTLVTVTKVFGHLWAISGWQPEN